VRVAGPSGEPAWGIQDGDRIVLEESASGPGERAVIAAADATFLPPFDERTSSGHWRGSWSPRRSSMSQYSSTNVSSSGIRT